MENNFEQKNTLAKIIKISLILVVVGLMALGYFYKSLDKNSILSKNANVKYNSSTEPMGNFNTDLAEKDLANIKDKYKDKYYVPKSKVPDSYYQVFNAMMNEVSVINETNQKELLPAINSAKSIIESNNNYTELEALVPQIVAINTKQKDREVILSRYINILEDINKKNVVDLKTKELTSAVISSARKLNENSIKTSTVIGTAVNGIIDNNTMETIKLLQNDTPIAIKNFSESSTKLVNYFAEVFKSEKTTNTTTGKTTNNPPKEVFPTPLFN
jgi:hypothetical protein